MPKVNPESGEPMSDAPEGADETRGGMERGDPGLDGATETGGTSSSGNADDNSSTQLPGAQGSDK